jgi:hypothetical protein
VISVVLNNFAGTDQPDKNQAGEEIQNAGFIKIGAGN